MEEVSEIIILEQYLRMLSPELQVWVRERDPRTAAEARVQQKTWYDPLARERNLEVGKKVLVMLPSQESKLLAKWQGPYEIKKSGSYNL